MQEILREIKFVPGILGSFVFIEKKGVVFSDLPDEYDEFLTQQVGRVVGRLFHMRKGASKGIESVDMSFDEAVITAHNVREDVFLVAVGDPTANIDLANLTINTLVPELLDSLGELEAETAAAKSKAAQPSAAKAKKAAPAPKAELGPPAPLRVAMPAINDALAHAIGPISQVVLDDCVDKWCKSGGATDLDWDQLAGCICLEISDQKLESEFVAKYNTAVKDATSGAIAAAPSPQSATATGKDLSAQLDKVQELLAQIIGPVAGVVMQDYVGQWTASGGAAEGRVDQLIEMLCKELDPGPGLDTFRVRARDILKA